ncbi:uncharacterized protein LOC135835479 isoform X2 [Planococcus citri]|uniref:uncharacterized protein LOC135835479 isoform X2 n=1 Tax=Planococcus citri TaxID=170843 RepID=UPI0031F9402A
MKIVLIYFLTIVLQIPFTTAGRNAKLKQRFTYQTSKRTGNTKPKYPKTFTPTEIPSELGRKMLKHKLYPRLLHILPQKRCDVLYHHGAKADAGNVLNFNDIKEAPNVTWEADPEQSYTLIFRDADDDQEKSASQGWLIINIPGNDVASGSVVHDYKLPALPKSVNNNNDRTIDWLLDQDDYIPPIICIHFTLPNYIFNKKLSLAYSIFLCIPLCINTCRYGMRLPIEKFSFIIPCFCQLL